MSEGVKFGLVPREWGDFKGEAVEQCLLAEKLGFDSIWVEEHHGNEYYLPSPLVALAALSQHVPKMHVGTAVALLPLYHPVRFASDGAVLDRLTGGRFIAGVAVGYRESEFRLFNVPLRERGGRVSEGLQVIRRLWGGERLTFRGRYYNVDGFELNPKPVQEGGPQIWVGGWVPKAIERAACLGDRWFPGPVGTLTVVSENVRRYREALRRYRKEFKGVPLIRDGHMAESEPRALAEIEEPVTLMYGEDYAGSGHPLLGGKGSAIQEWVEDRFVVGTPSQAIETISKLRKEGINYLILRLSLRGLPHGRVMESIGLFGRKVLPYFAEPTA